MPNTFLPAANMPSTSMAANVAGPSSLNKDKENEKEKGHSMLSRGRRPSPPPRQPSYSKRHASFDSPREIPMPSPSLQSSGGQAEFSYFDVPLKPRSPRKSTFTQQNHPSTKDKEKDVFSPVFEEIEGSDWTSVDKPSSSALSLSQTSNSQTQGVQNPPPSGASSHLYETYTAFRMIPAGSQQIHPFPRPYSLPHSSSSGSGGSTMSSETEMDNENSSAPRLGRSKTEEELDVYTRDQLGLGKPSWDSFNNVDRSSSASLPLPSQIPYHVLPKVGETHREDAGKIRGFVSEVARSQVPESSAEDSDVLQPETSGSSSGTSSTDTLPSASHSLSPSPPRTTEPPSFRSPPPFSSGAQHNPNIPNVHPFHSRRLESAFPVSSRSSSASVDDDSRQNLNSLVEATAHATALRRRPPSSHSSSSASPFSQPPEPPVILPPPSPPPNMGVMSSSASQRSSGSQGSVGIQSQPQLPPAPKITNASDLPPVLPPSRTRRSVPGDYLTSPSAGPSVSLDPASSGSSTLSYPSAANLNNSASSAPGALGQSSTAASRAPSPRSNAPPPYAPFLSHMPPPADSWIAVETTPLEYRLNIRLPGFKRDGITLSTKRRRILHIVADSWADPDPSPRNSSNPNPSESSTSQRGGHFERRISFGYDADLVGVRAEFDGEMLKIVVPRRQGMNGAMAPFL